MFGISPLAVKLIGGLVAALILLGLIAERGRWMHRAHKAEAQAAADCKATRAAANNPKLKCDQTVEQIGFLGETINALHGAIKRQNDAVDALGKESERQRVEAAAASQKAQKRAQGAEGTADRLIASSRSGARPGEPCKASRAVEEAWQ